MYRIAITLCLLPFLALSQEQVSDLEFFSVTSPTNVSSRIGFAEIDGEQYMLQENDSLIIHIWNGTDFQPMHIVGGCDGFLRNTDKMDPNRSLFEVRNNRYFRLFRDRIQLVDIREGEIIYEFDASLHNINHIFPREWIGNHFYFSGFTDNGILPFKLNMSTSELTQLENSNDFLTRQIGHSRLVVGDNGDIHIEDLDQQTDNILFNHPTRIITSIISRIDSSFYIVDEEGSIFKIDETGFSQFNCQIPILEDLQTINLNGDRLILSYNQPAVPRSSTIRVFNFKACEIEMEFDTPSRDDHVIGSRLIQNETEDTSFSIFSYYGEDPADGPSRGFFYFLDHENNTRSLHTNVYSVEHHTPFRVGNDVYFVAFQQSFWGQAQYPMKYSFLSRRLSSLSPPTSNSFLEYASLGYEIEGQVTCVTNLGIEEIGLWRIDEQENFNPLSNPEFYKNMGIGFIYDIIPLDDRIYFSTPSGLYSVLDNTVEEFVFPTTSMTSTQSPYALSAYEDYITLVNFDENNHPNFNTIDISRQSKMRVIDNSVTTTYSGGFNAVGPYFLYSNGYSDDTLKIYDMRNQEVLELTDIPYVSESWTAAAGKRALFYYRPLNQADEVEMFQIEYETNEIQKLEIELKARRELYAGNDNAIYFIDSDDFSGESTRIRRLDKENNLTTIFEAPGKYYSSRDRFTAYDESGTFSFFSLLKDGETSIIVADDGQRTEIIEIDFTHTTGNVSPLLAVYGDNLFLISRTSNTALKLLHYTPFEGIKELSVNRNIDPHFDENTLNAFYPGIDQDVIQYSYNMETGEEQTITYSNENCNRTIIYNVEKTSNGQYLLSLRCDGDTEPWIIDQSTNSLYQLADFNPLGGSSPYALTSHNGWVYFLATLKSGEIQWFRYSPNSTNLLEPIIRTQALGVFPMPAHNSLTIPKELDELLIYSINGILVKRVKSISINQNLDISELKEGSYLIQAIGPRGETYSDKFIKL